MNIAAKRIWMITDTHFGVRSNSREWMDIIESYFYDFFIPLLQNEVRPGDILVHCGDTFDSRQSLNLYVLNKGQTIIEKLAEILPVYVIIGNHDIFMKYSNEINSMKVFKHMENVTIFEQPIKANFGSKTGFFLPWVEDHEELSHTVSDPANQADILFCHTDVKGISFNKYVKIEEGTDAERFQQFGRVYSGHIHYAQKFRNVRMLGAPYELTRSDSGNTKGVWLLDLETDTEFFWENTHTPKFLKYRLEWILERSVEELQELFRNNFIDIMITPQWSLKFPFASFIENFSGYRKINHIIVTEEEMIQDEDDVEGGTVDEISLVSMIEKYIDGMAYPENIKEKLKSVGVRLYYDLVKEIEEKHKNENQGNMLA
jgi:DNA repair exonuclease SbcCD nuclease subunit